MKNNSKDDNSDEDERETEDLMENLWSESMVKK